MANYIAGRRATGIDIIPILSLFSVYRVTGVLYRWAPGLDSVPDVPHAVNVSFVTEGNGVGVLKEPPVNVKDIYTDNVCGGALASKSQVTQFSPFIRLLYSSLIIDICTSNL